MASIEKLLGHSALEIGAMSDAELLEKFADVFNLEKKLIDEGDLKVIKDVPDDDDTPEEVEINAEGEVTTKIKRAPKPRVAGASPEEKRAAKMLKLKAELLAQQKELAESIKNL